MAQPKEIRAADWDEVLRSDMLTIIDFWHNHCPWCLRLNPVFEKVAEEYKGKAKFFKVNFLEDLLGRC